MGSPSSKPEIPDNLPNPDTGWIANEFKEYNEKFVVVNTYKTLDRLGRGGFGTVYKVQHTSTGRVYALKYSKNYDVATREASIMMQLQHSAIAEVFSYFPLYDNKRAKIGLCIIMDFVDGENLREYLRRLPYPAENVVVMKWFITLLQALLYLHEQKIYHRDIKPENIIIRQNEDRSYSLILVDFGLTRQQMQDNQMTTVAGTLAYMSPELLAAGAKVALSASEKGDMWALGCVLYETWTKDLVTITSPGMIHKITTDPNFFRKLDDPSIEAILPKMLEISQDKRISVKELLNSDIITAWILATNPEGIHYKIENATNLLPHISILKDKRASFHMCLRTVEFLVTGLNNIEFDPVLVNQRVPLSLLDLLNKFTGEKEVEQLHSNCRLLLRTLLGGIYGDVIAFQICSNPNGIENLFSTVSGGTIILLCRLAFGFRTLERMGIQCYVRKLLQIEKAQVAGVMIYTNLSATTVPLELCLSQLVRVEKSPEKQSGHVSELLTRHADLGILLKSNAAYSQLTSLLATLIYSGLTKSLLLSLFHTLIPSPQTVVVECVNHRHCTTTVFGTNHFLQTALLCRKCSVVACLACAKSCHRTCAGGQYFSGLITCKCITQKDGKCIASFGNQKKFNTVADLQFAGDFELLPPPEDNYSWASSLRYNETSCEAIAPHCFVESSTSPFLYCRSKGFFLPSQFVSPAHTVFYFEVEILIPPIGPAATICVGVSQKEYPPKEKIEFGLHSSPSWGYYADTGSKIVGSKISSPSQKIYGPTYSTGDRVGCGVLSDGTVFYTLNGMYLGIDVEDAKIPTNCQVYSTIFVAGYSAHVRFIFDSQAFVFAPSSVFEVQEYLTKLPQNFTNVNLLQDSFGQDVNKIFDALNKTAAQVDLLAPIIVALLPCYPNFEDMLRSHPIYMKLISATTPFAKTLLENNLQLAPPTPPAGRMSLLAQQISSSPIIAPNLANTSTISPEMLDQLIEMRVQEKLQQQPLPSSFLVLRVVIDGLPGDEEFELVLPTNRLSKNGLSEALVELRNSLDEEQLGKIVAKITKENKDENNTVRQTRMMMTDANVQVLKNNDKLIVSFK